MGREELKGNWKFGVSNAFQKLATILEACTWKEARWPVLPSAEKLIAGELGKTHSFYA